MSDVRAAIHAKNIVAGCVLGGCILFLPNVVQSATSNSATLQWAANLESDLAGYRIYHGTAPGIYGVSQAVGKTPTYQYSNLEPNKTHYFTITAFDTSGNESLPSPEVSKTIVEATSQTASSPTTASNSQAVPTGGTTATSSSFPPSVVSPAPGSTLTSTSVVFTGANTSQDLEHSLRIGTSNGAADIYSKSMGTGHSVTVSGLPSTGIIYVWYWTRNTNGWFVNRVTYTMNVHSPTAKTQTTSSPTTASNSQAVPTGGTTATSSSFPPSVVSPAPGSTLTSTSVVFTGANTSQDLEHSLRIGTSNGATDIYSKSMGTGHSVTVSGLPSTGIIYVWYWTRNTNGWFVNRVTYTMNVHSPTAKTQTTSSPTTASNSQAVPTGGTTATSSSFPPSVVSPAPGSTLTSTSVVFTGANTSQDLEHSLRIGTSNGAADIYSKSMGTGHSVTVSGLPSTGIIYVWYWTRNTNGWFVNRVTYTMMVASFR